MHKSKIIIWNAIMKNDCTSKLFANPVLMGIFSFIEEKDFYGIGMILVYMNEYIS